MAASYPSALGTKQELPPSSQLLLNAPFHPQTSTSSLNMNQRSVVPLSGASPLKAVTQITHPGSGIDEIGTREGVRESIGLASTNQTSPQHQKHASVVAFAQQSPISAPAIDRQNYPTTHQTVSTRKKQNYLRSSQSSKSFGLSKTAAEKLNHQLSY